MEARVKSNIAHQKNETAYKLKAETLLEALENRARKKPEYLIFMDLKNKETRASAPEIVKQSMHVAQFLMARGLNKDDKIVIMLPSNPHFAYIFYGILKAGGVPVPISQPAGTKNLAKYLDNLSHIIKDCEAKFFITYQKIKSISASLMNVSDLVQDMLFDDEIIGKYIPESDYRELPQVKTDDLALIQYTAGTTGKPKGVVLTHKKLLHNIHGIGIAASINENDRGICWIPMYHDMGLIGGFLTTMYWGIEMILMQPEAFIFKPLWWLENITKYRATITVAPNFGYNYCTTRISDSDLCKVNLSTLRLALNGAEPVDRVTLNRFIEKFKQCSLRDDIFLPVFGMAENCLAATFPLLEEPTLVRRFRRNKLELDHVALDSDSQNSKEYIDLVSVGCPLVGQEVKITDDSGKVLNERQVGEICVKSNSLSSGYYKNSEATEAAFRDGWYHSGDLGFILDGMLYIAGRKKEMIIKRGKNIYPYDVERIASSVKGVRLGCTAAFDVHNEAEGTEDLVIVCETLIKDKQELERLKKEIHNEIVSRLGVAPDDIDLVPKGTIPKTTSGKVQRLLCKRFYLEDDLRPTWYRNFFTLVRTFVKSHLLLLRRKLF